jgi:flagellar assembly protein FliH
MILLSSSRVVKSYQQYEVPPEVFAAMRAATVEKGISSKRDEAAEAVQRILDEAAEEAKAIIRAAEEEASDIVRAAVRCGEDMKRDAEAEGFEAGYARGVDEGRRAAEATAAVYIEEIYDLAECIRRERDEALQREEKDLILIAVETAEKIMRRQCRVDANAVSCMLTDVVRENGGAVRLYLSEFQHTLAIHLDKNIIKKIKQFTEGLKTVIVKEEDGIMLETDEGVVDVSVPSQLAIIRESLTEDL